MKKKVLLSLLLVISMFIITGCKSKKEIKTSWGDKYLKALTDYVNNKNYVNEGDNTPKENGTYDVHFYDVKNVDEIVMVTNYEYNDNNYFNIFYMDDNKEPTYYKFYGDGTTFELLYDVEEKEYNYFIVQKVFESIHIYKAEDYVNYLKRGETPNPHKTISGKDVYSVKDANGNELPIYHDFDKEFIRVNEKDDGFTFRINDKEDVIKNNIAIFEEKVKKFESLITKSIKDEVNKKVESINKEKEEKKKEVVISDTFTLNGKTLHYGTYKADPVIYFESVIINSDGTGSADGTSCFWERGSHDYAQDESTVGSIKESIILNCAGSNYAFTACSNDNLCDGDIMDFNYVN